MADYYSIITNRGKELEAEALASGRLITLTHFVVGDSNGKQVKPDPAQVRLINETYRGDIAELVVSPEQSTQLMAKIVLPTGIGGFTVREVGLMTDTGELYAVANCPSIDKPVGGVSVNMQFRLAVSDTSSITLNVSTGDGLFLRIDQNLKEIKARGAEAQKTSRESIGVVDGSTQQKGLLQLNSAVNSTSETQSATPLAVKIAMDNANARLAKDRNGADIPNPPLFVQNIGLKPTVDKAANAVDKNGDTMTGNLTLKGDYRLSFIIQNEDGSIRAYIFKDKGGDGIRISNGNDGGGDFVFGKNGQFYCPDIMHVGNTIVWGDGNIEGSRWNGLLSDWLTNQLVARDNNINLRAPYEWVNQNFVNRVQRGAQASMTMDGGLVEAPSGCFLTGGNGNEGNQVGVALYRSLQTRRNNVWAIIEN
ncbi:phage tail protein [Citrobacter youngae]|nr:phage tail protein [Citrobacter youngae]MBU3798731.1 phage tail protein [Citrobacter youngae]